ncbi:MAG: trypsin-like peptidase domain-containing protein [Planctomycetes bacterium]|nr:trypsin-like peptidase domain-containing protein [Planctomycetota bacterium]
MFSRVITIALTALVLATGVRGQPAESTGDVRKSVVKVFSTRHYPDLVRPWSRHPPDNVTGTGVVLEGKRILTNAHVVKYARQVSVQPFRSADKYRATVVAMAPGIDLAVLELDDESFFDSHGPAPLSDGLPNVGDSVNVFGYPMGGDALSITEGVVSRIEFAGYYYETLGLRIQVDAALNPGNSGGPAVANAEVIGLVFSRIKEAENIGYVIPIEEIRSFLQDIEDGTYEGRPQLFERTQTLENLALRAKLGLAKDTTGVMIIETRRDDPDYPLRPWDVITAIGDYDIDNAGMVKIDDNLRLQFRYLVPRLASDGTVAVSVYRQGESLMLDVPIQAGANKLVKFLGGDPPSYFIYGPLVFTPLYASFARRLSAEHLVRISNPIATRGGADRDFEGEELVVVPSPMFPHPITKGYQVRYAPVLAKVNGVKVRNLRHLVETLRDLEDEFVVFEWADKGTETFVFRRSEIMESTIEILELNGIRAQYSNDLRSTWLAE